MCTFGLILLAGCRAPSVQAQSGIQVEPAFPDIRFTRPVDLQAAGDGSNRIFVVEQPGVIKVLDTDDANPSATVFLDIRNRVRDAGNEEGLLGLAFHPNYTANGFFFVYYTASSPRRSVLARYRVSASDPDRGDVGSEAVLLTQAQPASNHNGGQIAFGPDGYLYVGLGDGGGANDQFGNGQTRSTILGTILRIDVDTPSGGRAYGIPADNPLVGNILGYREEIYAYGLRNPWRFSFDADTGRLFTADVGQNAYEEINIIEKGGNYGWNTMEGNHCFRPRQGCDRTGLTLPVAEYAHNGQPKSVTGGYVYRGARAPTLTGQYIYADYVDGRIWALTLDGATVTSTELTDTRLNIASFGEDEAGELYICAFDGLLYRFAPTNTSTGAADVPEASAYIVSNHPNPFREETTIRYVLDDSYPIDLAVYNVQGRRLRSLAAGMMAAGEYTARWDGHNGDGRRLAAGVYAVRLMLDGRVRSSKQVVLLR